MMQDKTSFHLKGAESIMAAFGVSRETVKSWEKDGAPIAMIGRKYQANYEQLWTWIVQKHLNHKNMSTTAQV